MFELLRGAWSSHIDRQHCRVAFYHNLSPDPFDQTVSAELLQHQDKHVAEIYGVQLSEVYVDHAYSTKTERHAFEKMLEDAKNDRFDFIITKSIERFAPTAEDTITAIEELLLLQNPVTVIFESDMLDSNIIHSVVPILRGCCT